VGIIEIYLKTTCPEKSQSSSHPTVLYIILIHPSVNLIDGAVPRGGIFDIAGAASTAGNDHLCTNVSTQHMPLCSTFIDRKVKHKVLGYGTKDNNTNCCGCYYYFFLSGNNSLQEENASKATNIA